MMATARVADVGLCSTLPKAKPLLARRRRRKLWPEGPFPLNFEWFFEWLSLARQVPDHSRLTTVPVSLWRPGVVLHTPVYRAVTRA